LIIFKQKIYTIYLGAGDYILAINLEINSPASINIPTSPSSQYIMLINLRYTALRFSLFTNMTLKISINVSRLPVISASFYGENISNKTIYASRLYAITNFGNFNSTMLSNLLAVLFYIDGIIVGISNNVNTNYGMVIYSQLVYQNFIKLDLSNVKKIRDVSYFSININYQPMNHSSLELMQLLNSSFLSIVFYVLTFLLIALIIVYFVQRRNIKKVVKLL
jgi:hypothetical protein